MRCVVLPCVARECVADDPGAAAQRNESAAHSTWRVPVTPATLPGTPDQLLGQSKRAPPHGVSSIPHSRATKPLLPTALPPATGRKAKAPGTDASIGSRPPSTKPGRPKTE